MTQPQSIVENHASEDGPPDITPMLDSFRLAYTNLREIWSLVLPPQTLLGLKKMSVLSAESFRMPDALWARTVYDFISPHPHRGRNARRKARRRDRGRL